MWRISKQNEISSHYIFHCYEMTELTSLNLFTLDQLVQQVCEILGLPISKENIVNPAKDLDTTKMIYFAILREVGLADKIESNSAWTSGYRVHPELPSDIENHPEVFQVRKIFQRPGLSYLLVLRNIFDRFTKASCSLHRTQ